MLKPGLIRLRLIWLINDLTCLIDLVLWIYLIWHLTKLFWSDGLTWSLVWRYLTKLFWFSDHNLPSFLWLFDRWFVPFRMTSMQSTLFYSGELRSYLSPHVGPDSALRMTLVPVGWRFSCNREMSLSSRAHKPPDFVQNAILAGVTHLEGKHRAGQG